MMHIRITTHDCPNSTRQQVARELTDTVAKVLDLRPDNRRRISIQFEAIPSGCLAVGGELLTNGKNRRQAPCFVEINGPEMRHDTKRHLIEQLSRVCSQSLDNDPENVVVTMQEYRPENVAVGGELLAQMA